jgi:hypothetical protein
LQNPSTAFFSSAEHQVTIIRGIVVLYDSSKLTEECCVQGLKRISDEAAKELYPATVTEWASLLASDSGEIETIRPLLAQTSIERQQLRLAFDADQDGWNADAFHDKVNMYGAAVVIAQTEGGAVLGGYNPQGTPLSLPLAMVVHRLWTVDHQSQWFPHAGNTRSAWYVSTRGIALSTDSLFLGPGTFL